MNHKLIIVLLAILSQINFVFAQKFDARSVRADLEYLYTSLEQTHYNLYAFTPQADFLQHFNQLQNTLGTDSLSLLEATSLFQKLVSKANTGHAEIDFPASSYRTYAMKGGTVFPLELCIEKDTVYIRKNFSHQEELQVGMEITAINGVPIASVLDSIYPQLSAETPYFKQAKLEFWSFPRLYWQVFGSPESFTISVQHNHQVKHIKTPAIPLISDFEMVRSEIVTSNRFLQFHGNTAYLKPGNFAGDEVAFQEFVDSAFQEINSHPASNLILDLRNNGGGHNAFSDYLVAYFATQPFKWSSQLRLKTSALLKAYTRLYNDTTDPYFREILNRENGEIYTFPLDPYKPQVESKRFSGKVYVLINRHTYSMAAVTAALIQDYGFGKVVGEQTGDFPTLFASQFPFTLPHTGIVVKVPKGYMIRPSGKDERGGVIPDLLIPDHLVDEKDEILEGLLHILEED